MIIVPIIFEPCFFSAFQIVFWVSMFGSQGSRKDQSISSLISLSVSTLDQHVSSPYVSGFRRGGWAPVGDAPLAGSPVVIVVEPQDLEGSVPWGQQDTAIVSPWGG